MVRIAVTAVSAVAIRVSFTGYLGMELHFPSEGHFVRHNALLDAGQELSGGSHLDRVLAHPAFYPEGNRLRG